MISRTKAYLRIFRADVDCDVPWTGNSTLPVWLPDGSYYNLSYNTVTQQLIYANRGEPRYGVPLRSTQHNAHWAVCWLAIAAARAPRGPA